MDEKWIQIALELGATKAVILPIEQVVTDRSFRAICEGNACGGYGNSWTCPPFCGGIDELMEKVRSFKQVLWYQTVSEIEDSFDIEGMTEASRRHAWLSQKLRERLRPMIQGESLCLSAGGCRLCERCAKLDDEPCRMPDKAMTSLEACGVDVYNTTKKTDLKYINGQNTVTFFGAVFTH